MLSSITLYVVGMIICNDNMYRVVAMHKDLYDYVMSNLDARRKLSFWWMRRKKKVSLTK